MQFTTVARFNTLYWITSLSEAEQGLSRRILDDLEALCRSKGLPLVVFSPANAADLLGFLDGMASRSAAGELPMIHIDTHGSARDGIWVEPSKEFVGWPELARSFRTINQGTRNNLVVVSGACFSFHVVGQIDVNQVAPFYILLAPEQEVAAGVLEDGVNCFYQGLLDGNSIGTMSIRCFGTRFRVFHCEELLAIVLARYLNNAVVGKPGDRRKEALVTDARKRGIIRNRHDLRLVRKVASKAIRPTEALIERYRPVFLAGKKPGFTIGQLNVFVQRARAAGFKPKGPYAQ